jgi:rhodanese-related sulfurtransferase
VARALIDRGFRRVRPLAGGLEAWVGAGFAVEHDGAEPALERPS